MIWEKLAAFCFIICLFSLSLNLETGVIFFFFFFFFFFYVSVEGWRWSLTLALQVCMRGPLSGENMFSAGVWLGLSVEALTGRASV